MTNVRICEYVINCHVRSLTAGLYSCPLTPQLFVMSQIMLVVLSLKRSPHAVLRSSSTKLEGQERRSSEWRGGILQTIIGKNKTVLPLNHSSAGAQGGNILLSLALNVQ